MATTRFLHTSTSLGPPSSAFSNLNCSMSSTSMTLRCPCKAGFNGEKRLTRDGERKPLAAVKASAAASESIIISKPKTNTGVNLASVLAIVTDAVSQLSKAVTRPRTWKLYVQMLIEKAIIDSRFFTLFGVAGSLLGSVLCFVEGCFIILESYFQHFHALSQRSDQGHVVMLLIEAIDMFLVGTALLIFGMGLHVTFVGLRNLKGRGTQLPGSNLFGLFYLKRLPTWVGMQSITQAKSKIGHAVMMILQVGLLEKFKSIPLVTGLDLACFAGAVLVSSASLFLLSKLSVDSTTAADR